MELLVAIFIGGMVTVALVAIWRSASVQTSQGQRQAVVRNNMSIFLRAVYHDITEASLILFPNATTQHDSAILVGVNNARRNSTSFTPDRPALGPMRWFYYCFDEEGNVRYFTGATDLIVNNRIVIDGAAWTPQVVNAFLNGLPACTGGEIVMTNVNNISLDMADNDKYTLDMRVYRDFGDKSVPVNIDFSATFTAAGGV